MSSVEAGCGAQGMRVAVDVFADSHERPDDEEEEEDEDIACGGACAADATAVDGADDAAAAVAEDAAALGVPLAPALAAIGVLAFGGPVGRGNEKI